MIQPNELSLPEAENDIQVPQCSIDFTEERRDMLASFDSYVTANEQLNGQIGKLTVLQSETLLKVREFVAGNSRHGLLQLACGYGKSALATTVADALGAGRERPDGERRQVLVATSRNAIVKQLVRRNIQYNEPDDEDDLQELLSDFGYFAPRLEASMYNKFQKDLQGDVVVMPYPSLGITINRGIITPGQFPLYLLDESQHLGTRRQRMLEAFTNHGLFIGLSATPGKSREFLPTIIDKITLADGILKHKFLADIKMHGIATGCSFQSHGKKQGDYLPEDIGPLADNTARNELIVQNIYESVLEHGPGLVKCSRKLADKPAHIQTIADMANQDAPYVFRGGQRRRLRVEAVSAAIKGSQTIIDEFIHGSSIDALTFVDLIGEGFNMPQAKWGMWTPPTMSLTALEQFIGRGVRLSPNDIEKVFHFLQLMDVNTTANTTIHGWELFDLPRDIDSATISKETGVTYTETQRNPSADSEPTVRTIAAGENVALQRIKNLALDTMRAPEIEEELVSLDSIQERIGTDRGLLKRALFDGGFTAYPQIVEDMPTLCYAQEAIAYAESVIAKAEDKTVRQISKAVGMEMGIVLRWIHLLESPVSMVYPLNPMLSKRQAYRRQMHMNPDQYAQFRQKLHEQASALKPTEITFQDACAEAGVTASAARLKSFALRGFTLEERKLRIGKKSQTIGLRAELLPWAEAYVNAPPPPPGYTSLNTLAATRLPNGEKPTSEDIYVALANCNIKPRIFKFSHRTRADFVEIRHREALIKEITAVMQQRKLAEKDPSVPMPRLHSCIYGSDPSVVKDVETTQETVDDDVSEDLDVTEVLEEGNLDLLPIKIRQAVQSRHPAFSKLDPTSSIYAEQAENIMRRLAKSVTTPFPPLPREWVFLGDLADELDIKEMALVNLLIRKRIHTDHARFVEFNGIRGLLGFCSPELAKTLRNKHV